MQFSWDDDKAATNSARHGVTFEEAQECFRDPNAVEEFDTQHSDSEPRFRLIGLSERKLLLVVFSTPDEETIHIISARKAEAKFARLYEKQKL